MRHAATRHLAVAAGSITAMELFAVLLATAYDGRIPFAVHLLGGAAVAILVTVAACVALLDRSQAELADNIVHVLHARLDRHQREITGLHEHSRQQQSRRLDAAVAQIMHAVDGKLDDVHREVVSVTSTQRLTRIITDKLGPVIAAESMQTWKDLKRLEEFRELEERAAAGPGNVRPIFAPHRDD